MSGKDIHLFNQRQILEVDLGDGDDDSDDERATESDNDDITFDQLRMLRRRVRSQQVIIEAMQTKLHVRYSFCVQILFCIHT
jgi:hypothetical protein